MAAPLPDSDLDQLFRTARSYKWWTDAPVAEAQMRAIYDLAKWCPTANNITPARFVWLASPESQARLAPLIAESNREKMLKAPLTVIVAYDLDFPDTLPIVAPHAVGRFGDKEKAAFEALRSGTLQGAYLIMAARALGLDAGPMGGIDRPAIDAEFFAGTNVRTNFIVSIGEATEQGLKPRGGRLGFDEACRIL